MSDEQTTKFKVDISQLKKEFQEAQRHIRFVNSEFKAATAGMDDWSNNADGLGAKISQLNGNLESEKKKLESLQKQYALTVKEQGENSKGAQELTIKINNQEAAVKKIEAAIRNYSSKLNDLTGEYSDSRDAAEKLSDTISNQEAELASLKAKYAGLILEQGKSSKEARETAVQIKKLSSELQQNKATFSKAEESADSFDKTLDNVDESTEKVSDGFTVMKGALADLIADGIRAAADSLKEFVLESDSAYKSFQAQTGASAEEMKAFKEQMNNLYKNNYGESLADVGDKMAFIKQVTGETDPSKIRELAENAITLEDTFDSDFKETVRGVSNLMEHFGLDAEQAFDLFAKGSQEGLDYTDELGDNIAEYGGNFQQAGYSAEEYFQLLINGTKSGAYNLDKVNDSINEVKNRLGDDTIKDNLEIFSDHTQTAFKAWEDGKGTMKDVINSIVDDINNCTNEQEALNMAATAFGTMGEDANLKVVKSLKSTGKTFDNVKGTMEDVKKIKYDDIGSQFKQLGRTIQLDVIAPLAEDLLPTAKDFVTWATNNLQKLIPIAKIAGVAVGTIFAVNKTAQAVRSVKTLLDAYKALKIGIVAAAAQSTVLSGILTAMPFVAVGTAIVGVTLAMKHYSDKQSEIIEKEYGLSDAQKEVIENAASLQSAYEETNQARKQAVATVNAEYDHLSELKDELNSLVDANGQVKEGYEDRANFIVNELSNALGIEKEKIWDIIQSNGELSDSIDDVIQKKKAEAVLAANENAYNEAIEKRNDALSIYQDNLKTLEEAEEKYNKTKDQANKVMDEYYRLQKENGEEAATTWYEWNHKLIESNKVADESYEKAKKGVEDSEEAYVGYVSTIQNYEGLSSAIISGDNQKIQKALVDLQHNFVTAETGTKETLDRQVKNMEQYYESMQQAIADHTPGVTQEMVDQAAEMVQKAQAELDKWDEQATQAGVNAGTSLAEGAASTMDCNLTTGKDLASTMNKGMGSADTKGTGVSKANDYANGAGAQAVLVNSTGVSLSSNLNKGLGSANTNAVGIGQVTKYNSGAASVDTYSPGQKKAREAKDGLDSVDAESTGHNFIAGFINGMTSKASAVWDAAWGLAKKALSALSSAIKEGSPSRETAKSGRWFVLGFSNKISDMAKVAVHEAKQLGQQTVAALNAELGSDIAVPDIASGVQAARSAVNTGSGASRRISKETPVTNNYNFYQTNNSPKALSRLEIYRQTRNQLNFAKGV